MPDELEALLRAQRPDFDLPPLAAITARARVLRRRRRAVRAGAVALTLLAVALPVALTTRGASAPQVAASSPGGVWTGGGITVNGLPGLPRDLPGKIVDAEFIDADRGFLLTLECAGSCTAWVSATSDGGRTWSTDRAPGAFGVPEPGGALSLVVTGSRITLIGGPGRASSEDGVAWDTADVAPTTAALPGDARLILRDGQVMALLHDGTTLILPPAQPPLASAWVAPVRAGDGSWWVGGTAGGHPAVAVSRDGGATWTPTTFPGFPGTAQVSFLGRDVYVALTDPTTTPPALVGVADSADGGAHFGAPRPIRATTIGGDLIPLLDGRLLIVDGDSHWLVSTDRGGTWQRIQGLHPTKRLARTQTGWIAYDMSTIYTAYSVDGTTWQKLDAQ